MSMTDLSDWLQRVLGISPTMQRELLATVLAIGILYLISRFVLFLSLRKTKDIRTRYQWRKTTTYLTFALGIIIISYIWIAEFQRIAAYLGLISAALAFVLKEPILNIVGWVFIISRKPFAVGDRVQIGTHAGDVIDIRLFQFTINEIGNWVDADQSTGRIIHIPNSKIFSEPQANYTAGFRYIWNEVPVRITFESNWRKAKEILLSIVTEESMHLSRSAEQIVEEASQRFMILYNKVTPIVYTDVKDNGISLTMRYLCDPRRRRGSEQAIWEKVLDEFAKNPDIRFAYPTQRFYTYPAESVTREENGKDSGFSGLA